ncbi:MAG: SPFH domain-containing protein [Deltaproteobacteria bacterium]|nr:SPFH domain-containing protein [Deltaproteobacteria bacterium]
MGTNNLIFLEVLEWFDQTGQEMAHRIPEQGSGEIKFGAQLTVRESQSAVFFYQGKAQDAFGPGRHTLTTANIPVLTKILSLPWGLTSPLRAEVYFVNTRLFPNLKWGTRDPVAFKDSQLGLIRLRAFGVFNIRVIQPVLFVNTLVGTQGTYAVAEIEDYISRVIVSRFNDYLGEKLDTLLNLPGQYERISAGLKQQLQEDLKHFGLWLSDLYINAITPPQGVQEAMDDKSRLGLFDDLNRLLQMKGAMALEAAARNPGEAGAGMGLGMGLMMPALWLETLKKTEAPETPVRLECPECRQPCAADSRFCPACGHQFLVVQQCPYCFKNLPAQAKFCSQCGRSIDRRPAPVVCPHCQGENLPGAVYCNQCGEKIDKAELE